MDKTRRRLVLAPIALAALMAVGIGAPVSAQDATPAAAAGGTIEVTGIGEAETEAVGAVLQFILRAQFDGNVEPAADSEFGPIDQPEVTSEQVQAVVDGLIAAGVPEDKIASAAQPSGPYSGMFGYGSAVVAAELDPELLGEIEKIADAAATAGEEAGVIFDPVNAAYSVADCNEVERAALTDAVASGQEQAQMLAEVLGVQLGSLVKASKQISYGGYYAGGPSGSTCDQQPTLDDALTTYLSPFDPSRAGEVKIYVQVLFSYEIA